MKVVRGSEYQDFLRCRYRWAERWINKLEKVTPNNKLFFGNLFHKFTEVYYDVKDTGAAYNAMMTLFNDTDKSGMEQVEIDQLWELVTNVVNHYVDQWKQDDDKINVLATEMHIIIPLDDDIAFEGTIDLVYEDKDGNLWFRDYKTTSSIDKYDKKAAMDRQISRYWWALQQLTKGIGMIEKDGEWKPFNETFEFLKIKNKRVEGFQYDIVLRDYPRQPKELKNGGLSTDKRQKTTYKVYRQAMKDVLNLDNEGFLGFEDYQDILEHLAAQEGDHGNRFFRRVPVHRSQHEVNAAIVEFYHTSLDARDVELAIKSGQTQLAYRNINDDCSWDCPFKELCHATIAGDDASLIRHILYVVGGK